MEVMKLTEATFQQEALQSDKPVLVDFYADWCGPCKMIAPVVQEIANEESDYKICKLNVDEAPAIAAQYGVMSIPTLLTFKEGKLHKQAVGFQSKAAILDLFK